MVGFKKRVTSRKRKKRDGLKKEKIVRALKKKKRGMAFKKRGMALKKEGQL